MALLLPLTLSLRLCWPFARLASLWSSAWAILQPVGPTSYQVCLLLLLRGNQQLLHRPAICVPCLGGAAASFALLRPPGAGSLPEALLRACDWLSAAPATAILAQPGTLTGSIGVAYGKIDLR